MRLTQIFMPLAVILALGVALACVDPAWAGTELKIEHRDLIKGGDPATTSLKVGNAALRVAQLNQPDEELLFRAPVETVWLINHRKKQFHKLTKEDLKALAEQVAGALAQVQDQLASLPPEQRAMVEKMMQGNLSAGVPGKAPSEPGRWEKIASGEPVNRWTCDRYRYLEGSAVRREVWVTPLASAGVDPGAWTVMTKLGNLFKEFAEKMPMVMPKNQLDPSAWNLPPDLVSSSFPIKFTEFTDGQPSSETTFISMETVTFPPETFSLPKGYQELAVNPGS